VQQIGTPEELHAGPVNWHVADFMGYRNLLRLRAGERSGEQVAVEGDGLSLIGTPVGEIRAGAEVVAAVRPEDLVIGAAGTPATVEVVEYQGREVAVEARTDGGTVVNLRSVERPKPGDRVTLTVDPARLLVFPR
jgi:putative spermidine/putrescine transport system ATP-binding protein